MPYFNSILFSDQKQLTFKLNQHLENTLYCVFYYNMGYSIP